MERLLKPEEIAEILGVKVSTIYQWTHQGFIPHVKIRNLVRFRLSQVEKWLEKKTIQGRSRRKLDVSTLIDVDRSHVTRVKAASDMPRQENVSEFAN